MTKLVLVDERRQPVSGPRADEVIYVGIDLGKTKWAYHVRWGGQARQSFAAPAGLEHLQALVERYPGNRFRIAYETCGFGYSITWWAQSWGKQVIETVAVAPSKLERAPGRRVKTDRIDACRLALEAEKSGCKRVWVPPRELTEARQVNRTQIQIAKEVRRAQTQIRSMMTAHGYTGPEPTKGWGAYVTWLEQVSMSTELRVCVDHLRSLRDKAAELNTGLRAELRALGRKEPYRTPFLALQGIVGIGWLTAIRLVLELGDIGRFSTRGSLSHYLGLTPSEYSSSDSECRGPIMKCGPKQIRSWLVECAWTAIRKDEELRAVYRRICGQSASRDLKKKAITAVARRLAVRVRGVWRESLNQDPTD